MKKLALAAVLLSGCADDGEPATVEGHWQIVASVAPCLVDPVTIDMTIEGEDVMVPATIAGESVEMLSWDEFKFALTIITSGAEWTIQVDPETDSARVWYDDGGCSVSAVPAASVERD